jgi:hypothetical protein
MSVFTPPGFAIGPARVGGIPFGVQPGHCLLGLLIDAASCLKKFAEAIARRAQRWPFS